MAEAVLEACLERCILQTVSESRTWQKTDSSYLLGAQAVVAVVAVVEASYPHCIRRVAGSRL